MAKIEYFGTYQNLSTKGQCIAQKSCTTLIIDRCGTFETRVSVD